MRAEAYSETKMVTTGILDSPDALNMIPIAFFKTLVYFLYTEMSAEDWSTYVMNHWQSHE